MSRADANDVTIPAGILGQVIEALEMAGCQFWACEGETLEPVDMVTCQCCAALAQLKALDKGPPS